MEIIPYSFHLPLLLGLVGYAVYRGSVFPLALTATYTAFFHITYEFESITFLQQIIIQSTLASMLLTVATTFGQDVRYASRFSLCMLIGILNLIVMYSTRNLENGYYLTAQIFTASITYTLNLFEFYFMYRMIHDSRGDRVSKKLYNWFVSSLSVFNPNKRAIPFYYWQAKGER